MSEYVTKDIMREVLETLREFATGLKPIIQGQTDRLEQLEKRMTYLERRQSVEDDGR